MTQEKLQEEINKARAKFQTTGHPRDKQQYEDLEDTLHTQRKNNVQR